MEMNWVDLLENEWRKISFAEEEPYKPKTLGCYATLRICPAIAID